MKSYDVVVIVPLAEEFDHVKQVFDVERSFVRNKITFYELSLAGSESSRSTLEIVGVVLSRMGNANAAQTTERVLSTIGSPRPKLVALVGIAGRLNGDLRLGDVVVGTEISNYEIRSKLTDHGSESDNGGNVDGEVTEDELDDFGVPLVSWKFGGRTHTVAPEVAEAVAQFRNNETQYDEWQTETSERVSSWVKATLSETQLPEELGGIEGRSEDGPKLTTDQFDGDVDVATEPLASGSFVVTASEFADRLSRQNRNFAAVEMEAAGVLLATGRTDGVNGLVVRGISDFADDAKTELDGMGDGLWRKCATYAAANYLSHFLHNGYVRAMAPQRPEPTLRSDSIGAVRTSDASTADPNDLTANDFSVSPGGPADNYVRRYVDSSRLVVRGVPPRNGLAVSTTFRLETPDPLRLVSAELRPDPPSRTECLQQLVDIDGVRQSTRTGTETYLTQPVQFMPDDPVTVDLEKRMELADPSEDSIESGDSLPVEIHCEFMEPRSDGIVRYVVTGQVSPVDGLQVAQTELHVD